MKKKAVSLETLLRQIVSAYRDQDEYAMYSLIEVTETVLNIKHKEKRNAKGNVSE